MKSYLVFFGSSDGFESEAFEFITGNTNEFKTRFKNFDQLDPKILITDSSNTKVTGNYFTQFNGVNLNLIKIYSSAQAYSIARDQGTNIGVALVSENTLSFSANTLKLLNQIFDEFKHEVCDRSVSGNGLDNFQFKSKHFTSEAERIFKKWQLKLINSNLSESDKLNAIHRTGNSVFITKDEDENSLKLIRQNSTKYLRTYICSSRDFVEKQKETMVVFIIENQSVMTLKEYDESLREKPKPVKPGADSPILQQHDYEHQIRVLEDRISKANRYIEKLSKKLTLQKWGLMLTSALILFLTFKLCFVDEPQIEKNTIDKPEVTIVHPIPEKNYLQEAIANKDSSTILRLSDFLNMYIKTKKNQDSLIYNKKFDKLNEVLRLRKE